MQTAVAVGFGIFDIILAINQRQIVLPHQHVSHGVDILNKRAYHADAADIVEIFHHGLQRDGIPTPFELADDAARCFDTAFDRVDWIGLARNARFIT